MGTSMFTLARCHRRWDAPGPRRARCWRFTRSARRSCRRGLDAAASCSWATSRSWALSRAKRVSAATANAPRASAASRPSSPLPRRRVNVLWAFLRDGRGYELTPPAPASRA